MKQGQTAQGYTQPVGSQLAGYTIVEVIIVMAITAALLISALALISGQQQRTEFSQSINDINSQIQDVMNDVSTGYYANTGNFTCDATGLHSGTNNQGTNKDCIFIGRAMQFGVGGNKSAFDIYNIIGQRQITSGGTTKEVQSFAETQPLAIALPNVPSGADATDRRTLNSGLTANKMYYLDANNVSHFVSAVAFMTSFANYSGGNLVSGAQTVSLVPIDGTDLATNNAESNTVSGITTFKSTTFTQGNNINPASGVVICFQSGGTNQYGQITIGGNGRQLTTDLIINAGTCP
jgi:type II secretory pathway pseudopilin PulG